MTEQPRAGDELPNPNIPAAADGAIAPELDDAIVDGDAATHLEALVYETVLPAPPTAGAEGLQIELGASTCASPGRSSSLPSPLSDFVNNHEALTSSVRHCPPAQRRPHEGHLAQHLAARTR